jgi:drug/metabolite transporter (DMT)-like permease
MDQSRTSAYILLVLNAMFSGGVFVAGKLALAAVPPLTVALVRFAVATLLLWIWMRQVAPGAGARRVAAADLPLILTIGLTAMAGFNILLFYGLTLAPATDAAIITPGVSPILTAVLAWRILGERISRGAVAGLITGAAGLALVVSPSGGGSATRVLGDVLFALGSSTWAVYAIIGKAATRRFTPLAATFYGCVTATIVLLPFSLAEGGLARLAAAPAASWAGLLYLAVFPTALSFVFFYIGVARVGPVRATSFALLIPVFGVLTSLIVLGERLAPRTVMGGALVLLGLWLVQTRPDAAHALAPSVDGTEA